MRTQRNVGQAVLCLQDLSGDKRSSYRHEFSHTQGALGPPGLKEAAIALKASENAILPIPSATISMKMSAASSAMAPGPYLFSSRPA